MAIKKPKVLARILVGATLLILAAVAVFLAFDRFKLMVKKGSSLSSEDKYVAFLTEVYETVEENYWDKISDEQLSNIFVLGAEKLLTQPQASVPKDKAGLQKLLGKVIKEIKDESKKKEFTTNLADMVLANLQPFGRSRLYSQKQETDLKNTVENRNPGVDQYQILEVDKDASQEEIQKTYQQKSQELEKDPSLESQQKLAQLQKAYQALGDKESRETYDQSGVEPTMDYKLLTPGIFYLHLNKFSPTTVEELSRVSSKMDNQPESLNGLILDLRDNVGGAIDGLPYFLGPFIGNDQYAYQFFHQGEKEDFKTKIGWLPSLVRYKKVVVLINENTQSSAEVMASTLKKYNVGVLVGTTTRGWGTVERVFDLKAQLDPSEKYSVFLVHRLTLREDGLPIESKGVEPTIDITDPSWPKILSAYFNSPEMVNAVKQVLKD